MGFAFGLLLVMLSPGSPDEHILIGGRVRMAQPALYKADAPESRRFEITISRRAGVVIGAQACLFADLRRDGDWDGACFALEPRRIAEAIGTGKLKENDLSQVDTSAQRLLRILADESTAAAPGRRILGYDAEADLELSVAKFPEADL